MFCTNCGKELKPNDKFCANCGCEVKASQSENRKYDNVVFNPPFRMEAEKKTAQILKNREEFKGFREIAEENSKRNVRSKAKMDWNLEGFPESVAARGAKSSFDWESVVERRNSGRSYGFEKLDMSSTMEHKKVSDKAEDKAPAAKEAAESKADLGLPPEDSRVISLEELEKELYDLEEELREDTARTAKYEPFKLEDIDNSEELDAYLDGLQKTPRKKEEKQEPPVKVKRGEPMRWDLNDKPKDEKKAAMAPMGLVWGIDPDELIAQKKASRLAARKEAKKEAKMVWDLEEKEKEPEPAAPAAVTEKPAEPEPEVIIPQEKPAEPATVIETPAEPEPAPEVIPEVKPSAEVIPEVKPEEEVIPEVKAETPFFDPSSIKAPDWNIDSAAKEEPVLEVEEEYKDLIKNAEPEYLERTRIFDQAAIKAMDEEKKAEETAEEPEVKAEPEAPAEPRRPLYQSDFVHPWERKEEPVIQEEPASAEEPAPVEEPAPAEEPAPLGEELVTSEPEVKAEEPLWTIPDFTAPEETVPEEPAMVPEEEPAPEVPAEEEIPQEEVPEETVPEEEPVEVSEVQPEEEPEAEEPVTAEEPAPAETQPEEETKSESTEEKPMFFTFSQKNDAFQKLLQKERERLDSMGAEYSPVNSVSSIKPEKVTGLAYEEGGVFVEEVVQPTETTVADLSGDAKPNVSHFKYSFMTDGDWLKEMTSANDLESLNKTKLRYSDLFPSPLVNKEEVSYGLSDDEESKAEKMRKAEDLNRIFDEAENEKQPKHIIGNTIMILLIILVLFEGSVLAAKLLAPDSKYAHISDNIIEKVIDLFTGDDETAVPDDSETAPEDVVIDDTDTETGSYASMASDISLASETIGEVVYSEGLVFSDISDPAFDGVESMQTLVDSKWMEKDGKEVTYAEEIFKAVAAHYNEWSAGNSDSSLLGINTLELGEIRSDGEGYYILTRTTYATESGNTESTLQTCYLTVSDDTMFINEIKQEVMNG